MTRPISRRRAVFTLPGVVLTAAACLVSSKVAAQAVNVPPAEPTPSASAAAGAETTAPSPAQSATTPPAESAAPTQTPPAATEPTLPAKAPPAANSPKSGAAAGEAASTSSVPAPSATESDAGLVESEVANQEGPQLQFYGFMDFTYQKLLISKNNAWRGSYPGDGSFAIGNLNLYMSSELGKGWSTLAEIRFTYLPLGAENYDARGNIVHTDTTVRDYADFERPMQWGGIEIERAFIDYSFTDWLGVTAGQWLTPYGIWNVDHGSPTIIAAQRPFIIGEALFPERQTGLELHGKFFIDATTLGYLLTLSNGRGPAAAYRDYDSNKAVGARVFVENRSPLGTLVLGASGYTGKYTDANRQLVPTATSDGIVIDTKTNILAQYDELSVAGDLSWDWNALHVQSEIIMNETRFNDAARPIVTSVDGTGFAPDYRRWGVYGLAAYRLPVLNLMPFAMLEYYNFAGASNYRTDIPATTALYLGLNVRPTPRVTLKAEYVLGMFHDRGNLGFGRDNIALGLGQIAWSF